MHALDPNIIVYWPAPSIAVRFCEELRQLGHKVVGDIYPDLSYDDGGHVVIKRQIHETDIDFAVSQVKTFLAKGQVETESGAFVDIDGASICVHGDGNNAIALARAVQQAVLDFGVTIETVSAV